jgi:hypothetical protein
MSQIITYFLHSALLLTTPEPSGSWSKVVHYIENRVLSGSECEMKVRLKSLRQLNCNGLYYNTQSNHTELIGTFIVNTVFLFCSLSPFSVSVSLSVLSTIREL